METHPDTHSNNNNYSDGMNQTQNIGNQVQQNNNVGMSVDSFSSRSSDASNISNSNSQNGNVITPTPSYSSLPSITSPPASLHGGQPNGVGHHLYNQSLHSGNLYVPAQGVHQSSPMYATMMSAQLPSNVYVNNVTANVNLHGWTHAVPAYVPGAPSHYLHSEVPPDQVNGPVMQALTTMPLAIPPGNTIVGPAPNCNQSSSGMIGRGARRGRGRGVGGISRRGEYNNQRYSSSEAGSPASQQSQIPDQIAPQQQLQQVETAQLMAGGPPGYAPQAHYAQPSTYAPYAYPAYFAPQSHLLHQAQNAQQAASTQLYVPMYNPQPVYVGGSFIYPPVLSPPEYQFMAGDESQGDDRQNVEGMVQPIWHPQQVYAEEYAMSPEMHAAGNDEINQNAAHMDNDDTPTMISPNYAIYDPQMHEVQQHMGMVQIYEDPQMAQMQSLQCTSPISQLDDEIEVPSQSGAIQMVPSGAILTSGAIQMSNDPQIIHQCHAPDRPQQSQHLLQTIIDAKPQHQSSSVNKKITKICQKTSKNVPSMDMECPACKSRYCENIFPEEILTHGFHPYYCQLFNALNKISQGRFRKVTTLASIYHYGNEAEVLIDNSSSTNLHTVSNSIVTLNEAQQQQQNYENTGVQPDYQTQQHTAAGPQQIHHQPLPLNQHHPLPQQNDSSKVIVDSETPSAPLAASTAVSNDMLSNNNNNNIKSKVVDDVHDQQEYVPNTNLYKSNPVQTTSAVVVAAATVASVATTTDVLTQQQQIQTSTSQQKYHHQQQQQQKQQYAKPQQPYNRQEQHLQNYHQNHQNHSHHNQQPVQHHPPYEQRRQAQLFNNQQTRRKYSSDYSNTHQSNASNNSSNSNMTNCNNNSCDSAVQTTKSMSWTNSNKKSTASVAVTATPQGYNSSSNGNGNKQSSYNHIKTYTTSQQHHYQQQQSHPNHQTQQQQHGGNGVVGGQHNQQPQMRSCGTMKLPSSPAGSNNVPPTFANMGTTANATDNSSDSKCNQTEQPKATLLVHANSSSGTAANQVASKSNLSSNATAPVATSTASTTAVPQHFLQHQQQQSQTQSAPQQQQSPPQIHALPANQTQQSAPTADGKQYPGFTSSKRTVAPNASTANTTTSTPTLNLAPPVPATTTTTSSSTQSWASLFNKSSNAAPAATTSVVANNSSQPNSNNITTVSNGGSTSTNNTTPALAPPSSSKKPIAKVAPYECTVPILPDPPVVTPGGMTYAAASTQGLTPAPQSKINKPAPAASTAPVIHANVDEYTLKFADSITKAKIDLSTVSLRPRGLTNPSNYCYINSILQALLGCAPFYNLMRSLPKQAAALSEVRTPTINAMIAFMLNFSTLPLGLRMRTNKGPKGKDELGSELQCDTAFEPVEIYRFWIDSREEYVEGRQEDAEEFLSYVLNKINDEMLEVLKMTAKPALQQNGKNELSENEDGDEWQMICNNRNKGSVTRQTDFGRTPLSDIFRGELRSRLQREGEHSTDAIQPFFTLQLNIEKAASVKEALEILVGRDQLEGVTGSKSKQEVVAWQQMTLEKLPIILILHLKWFDYRSDGCTKILKKVEFPVELKIDAKILASKKYSQKQRAYRLFAVVYHDGKEATKGHYITDVFHTGYNSWLRYNDSSVKPVTEYEVLYPKMPRVPYLLFYRRCDTMPQQPASTTNNNPNNHTNSSNYLAGGRERDSK